MKEENMKDLKSEILKIFRDRFITRIKASNERYIGEVFDEIESFLSESMEKIKLAAFTDGYNSKIQDYEEIKAGERARIIKIAEGMKKEQLDKNDPDNYGACYAIGGFNDALNQVIKKISEEV